MPGTSVGGPLTKPGNQHAGQASAPPGHGFAGELRISRGKLAFRSPARPTTPREVDVISNSPMNTRASRTPFLQAGLNKRHTPVQLYCSQ